MSISNKFCSKSNPRQVAEGVLAFLLLCLPLYLFGYHQGASPVFGVAIAITLGALGVQVVTTNGVLPEVRHSVGAFSWRMTALCLGVLFVCCLLCANAMFSTFGTGTVYELPLTNQYANPLKPLSHLLYGAGLWSLAQLVRLTHATYINAVEAPVFSSRALICTQVRTLLRWLPLMGLGVLALVPQAALIVLPLMLVGLIHHRNELLMNLVATRL